MLKKILNTNCCDYGLLITRIFLGLVMFPHGAQKVLGWFGGGGFNATMGFFTQQLHIPAVFAFLAIMAEFLGSIGLIVGLGTRMAAFGIGSTMAVAVLMIHSHVGFFMNWFGSQQGEGFEYHLLVIGMALVLMIKGGGAFSLDGKVAKCCDEKGSCCPGEKK